MPSVRSIHVYPVKSMRGLDVTEGNVEPWGLEHDRRWVVLSPDGSRISAREDRRLLGLTALPGGDGGVRIVARDGSSIDAGCPVNGELATTSISRLDSVRLAEPGVHAWLSDQLDRPVRLGWLDDPFRRPVSQSHGGRAGEPLTLADAGPLLVTSVTSLGRLNQWMAESPIDRNQPAGEVEMARFRPNVVVEGIDQPFAEDGWTRMRIGDVTFRQAERCDRCMMTMLDPETLALGKEPLRSLARHRKRDGKVWFGVRVIPESLGRIEVGAAVSAL